MTDQDATLTRHERRRVALPGGTLDIQVRRADLPLDSLCAFATRNNPRRAFLVVSRLLGRHIPARPAAMRGAMRRLAGLVPADLPQPLLVVGMAETAVCLGQGVHEELVLLGRDASFIHSTRQRLDRPLLCRFDEPHSHAARHLLYRPAGFDAQAARTLVLVDDEVSTGTTIVNLAAALVRTLPRIEAIVVATLTDWSGDGSWLARMPRPARCVSLLDGTLAWESVGAEAAPAPPPDGIEAGSVFGTMTGPGDYGRLGYAGAPAFRLPALDPPEGPVRVVGTGEFTYPPFRLAEQLEQAGADVVVQAATRSPVRIGGPIANALRFSDNYSAAVPNFLYNAAPGDGRRTYICHETPAGSIDPALLRAMAAETLFFGR